MQLQGSNKQVYSQLADSIRWSILLTDYNFSLQGGGGGLLVLVVVVLPRANLLFIDGLPRRRAG